MLRLWIQNGRHDVDGVIGDVDGDGVDDEPASFEPTGSCLSYDCDALSATATEDGSWTFSANGLLGNDYDPRMGRFSIVSVTSESGCAVTGPVDGEFDIGDITFTTGNGSLFWCPCHS